MAGAADAARYADLMHDTTRLLFSDEPDPVVVDHPGGSADFLLTCDHAGRRMPRRLGQLGLPDAEMERHIAYDIGARAVAEQIAETLDATLIRQVYSRLVIDCNRDPAVPSSIPLISELTAIPGNEGVTAEARAARIAEIFTPYHAAIAGALDQRAAAGRAVALVSIHSFTPVFKGVARPWHAAVLYNRDARLSRLLRARLEAEGGLVIGDNEPYVVSDLNDYTIPVHAERRGLPYLEIEIRQDLITDAAGQRAWAARLIRLLPAIWQEFQAG